jgi:hypothetical protein
VWQGQAASKQAQHKTGRTSKMAGGHVDGAIDRSSRNAAVSNARVRRRERMWKNGKEMDEVDGDG